MGCEYMPGFFEVVSLCVFADLDTQKLYEYLLLYESCCRRVLVLSLLWLLLSLFHMYLLLSVDLFVSLSIVNLIYSCLVFWGI